jgi:ADP-heptose:LPS heptosyltransferase
MTAIRGVIMSKKEIKETYVLYKRFRSQEPRAVIVTKEEWEESWLRWWKRTSDAEERD